MFPPVPAMGTTFSEVATFEEMNDIPEMEAVKTYEKKCGNFLLNQGKKLVVGDAAKKHYQQQFEKVIGCEVGLLAKEIVKAFPWQVAVGVGVAAIGGGAIAVLIDSMLKSPDEMTKMKEALEKLIVDTERKKLDGVMNAKIEQLHTRVNHYPDEENTTKLLIEIEKSVLEVLMIAKNFLAKEGEQWTEEDFKMFNLYKLAASVYLITAEMSNQKGIIDDDALTLSRVNRYTDMMELVPKYLDFRRKLISLSTAKGPHMSSVSIDEFNSIDDHLTKRKMLRGKDGPTCSDRKSHYMTYLTREAWTLTVAIEGSLCNFGQPEA